MYRKLQVTVASCALGLAVTAAAQAAAPELTLVDKPANRFERAISTHKLQTRYSGLIEQARKLGAQPAESFTDDADVSGDQLRRGIRGLEARVEKAKREAAQAQAEQAAAAPAPSADFGLAGGVSQATLETIAACESGGDPTAVNAGGYYGKYQFDLGTWASVGGTGNPAEASETEQDYRASLLYEQAGSSPWPVCGV